MAINSILLTNEWINIVPELGITAGNNYTFSNNGGVNIELSPTADENNVLRLNSNLTDLVLKLPSELYARVYSRGQSGTLSVINAVTGGGGSGGDATDLGYTATASGFDITSSTGSPASVPNATTTDNGAMGSSDKTKLNGIEAEATKTILVAGTNVTIDDDGAGSYTINSSGGSSDVTSVNGLTGDVELFIGSGVNYFVDKVELVTNLSGVPNANVDLGVVNTTLNEAGLMSPVSQTKLDGVEDEATKTILSAGTNISITDDGAGTYTINADAQADGGATSLNINSPDGSISYSNASYDSGTRTLSGDLILADSGYLQYGVNPVKEIIEGNNVTFDYLNDTLTINATGGASSVDLSTTFTANNFTVVNSAGTNAVVPGATTGNAGALTSSDKTKLDGIAEEATKNILVAGTNVTIDDDGAGTFTINATDQADGGATNIALASPNGTIDIANQSYDAGTKTLSGDLDLADAGYPQLGGNPIKQITQGNNISLDYSIGTGLMTINASANPLFQIIECNKGPNDFYTLYPDPNAYYLRLADEIVIDLTAIQNGVAFTLSTFNLGNAGQVYVKGNTSAILLGLSGGENLYQVGVDTDPQPSLVQDANIGSYEVANRGIPLYLNAAIAQYNFVVYNGNLIGG